METWISVIGNNRPKQSIQGQRNNFVAISFRAQEQGWWRTSNSSFSSSLEPADDRSRAELLGKYKICPPVEKMREESLSLELLDLGTAAMLFEHHSNHDKPSNRGRNLWE